MSLAHWAQTGWATAGVLLLGGLIACMPVSESLAQSARPERTVAIKALGLTFHPIKAARREFYARKLTDDGRLTANVGILASFEQTVYRDRVSLRTVGMGVSDCRSVFAGLLHLGVHSDILTLGPMTVYLGLGPAVYFRQDWHRFDNYADPTGHWNVWKDWQYVFTPIGGDIEFDFRLSGGHILSFTVVPGVPEFVIFAVGTKFKI